jgi:nicotinamide-nucleotide amidase
MNAKIKKILTGLGACDFKIVTAESCTVGMLASMIGDVPGCGQWLECAFVTYSVDAKKRCLGVRKKTIDEFGLSSEEVAREMALRALSLSKANLAIATTGVADGPAPDGETIPGTVCFSWAFELQKLPTVVYSETRIFKGTRNAVRRKACEHAISRIRYFWQLAQGLSNHARR